MEKSMDTLRQTQAKCSELEKANKKLYSQTHTDRKEIIKLREVSRRNNNHTRYKTCGFVHVWGLFYRFNRLP